MTVISLFDRDSRQCREEAAALLAGIFPHAYGNCAQEEMEKCLDRERIAVMAVQDGHLAAFAVRQENSGEGANLLL